MSVNPRPFLEYFLLLHQLKLRSLELAGGPWRDLVITADLSFVEFVEAAQNLGFLQRVKKWKSPELTR